MKNRIFVVISILAFVITHIACKKMVQVDGPTTSINSKNIYEKDITAISVLTGVYINLSAAGMEEGKLTSISYLAGLSSDELTLYSGENNQKLNAYYTNNLNGQLPGRGIAGSEFWDNIYSNLYVINEAIEGISGTTTLTAAVKQQLLGEAKFIRGFYFFYLVNLFGDVPLILTTNYKVNSLMPRTPATMVWSQILTDLKDAQSLLSPNYLDATLLKATQERVRPTRWAASALLARCYLYLKDWKSAEEQSEILINNQDFGLVKLDDVFKRNNKEAIWQLQPVYKGSNSQEANTFILLDPLELTFKPSISQTLFSSFEDGDQRKNKWLGNLTADGINYPFAYKYKIPNSGNLEAPAEEYSTVFRLAEQYLIRSEARIQQGKVAEGIADLNLVRERATDKTSPTDQQLKKISTDLSKNAAMLSVEHERQVELFTEWGHRWLDLKRSGIIEAVMSKEVPKKIGAGVWSSYQQYYPISFDEIHSNPKLTQNNGY